MGVTQRVDGDAAGEIEVAFARSGDQPGAFSALEDYILAGVGGHDSGGGTGGHFRRLGLGTFGGLHR
jgi:hypothetical protein